MNVLNQIVETHTISTIEEAEAYVAEVKKDPEHEGYEVKGYKITKKEKKSKGEIIDEFFIVVITKVWNN